MTDKVDPPNRRGFFRRRWKLLLGSLIFVIAVIFLDPLWGYVLGSTFLNLTATHASFENTRQQYGALRVSRMERTGNEVTVSFEFDDSGDGSPWNVVRGFGGRFNPDHTMDVWARVNMVDYDGRARGAKKCILLRDSLPGACTIYYLDPDGTRHQLQDVNLP